MSLWTAKSHELRRAQAQQLADILREIDPDDLEDRATYIATAGGDERRLRGIPAIGRSVTGAIAGSQPERAVA